MELGTEMTLESSLTAENSTDYTKKSLMPNLAWIAIFMIVLSGFLAFAPNLFAVMPYREWIAIAMAMVASALLGLSFARMSKSSSAVVADTQQAESDSKGAKEIVAGEASVSKPEIVTLSYTDRLTRLGNEQRMMEKFKTLANSKTGSNKGFLVGMADMDGMKPVNDLYGFNGGDEILKQCAQRLSAAVEKEGYVFRTRGDEFGFLFPEITDHEGAEHMGRILQEVLLAPFDLDGGTVRLSGSFGFALYPDAGNSIEVIMRNIESALYHSKRGGRGRITVYSNEIEQLILEKARMEQALRRAVANDDVQPHFQPIISLQDGKLLGFEALARWIDPELGMVSPGKFIPLAEERGIISSLTDKLLLHAARVAAGWPGDFFLSFNLSSVQLVDPTTAKSIIKTIKKAGLEPERLEIEVTETAMMTDPETASAIIDELHSAGIRVSMDDFGTGQSSLGRLRELKLDKVKIDRAFIMAIGDDKPAEHIVRAILEMCAGLDLTVVAEGIEEMAQAESLKRYGCHAGQGYLFGKAQDEHQTMGYIREFIEADHEAEQQRQAC